MTRDEEDVHFAVTVEVGWHEADRSSLLSVLLRDVDARERYGGEGASFLVPSHNFKVGVVGCDPKQVRVPARGASREWVRCFAGDLYFSFALVMLGLLLALCTKCAEEQETAVYYTRLLWRETNHLHVGIEIAERTHPSLLYQQRLVRKAMQTP